MIARFTVISAVMMEPVRVIYANVIGNITVCVVSFFSHALCWKLIRKERNYWERVRGLIVTKVFPTMIATDCQYTNALYKPVK